ncbi:MAG: SAM-dependent methyltransferase, partial [Coprococcus sp.]
FINIEHSPKNILIRSVKKNIPSEKRKKSFDEAVAICQEFGITQTLMKLITERKEEQEKVL